MPAIIRRYIEKTIENDLKKKMVFLAGPRQVGKTTFAKEILRKNTGSDKSRYLNWDINDHREKIIREHFPVGSGLIVLDEIHKYTRWRQVVKGLFDHRRHEIQILVTGH